MASTPKVYVICDNNCRWESMTKEQIITAIEQALETGTVGDVDAGFITKIKETNASGTLQFWIGTTAQYNAIETKDTATLYILTDDDASGDFDALAENVNGLINGSVAACNATNAANAANAKNAENATNAAKVNDLEIKRDSNGVLKIGDTIIPQKKVLWSGLSSATVSSGSVIVRIPINQNVKGKTLEIEIGHNIESIGESGIYTRRIIKEKIVSCGTASSYVSVALSSFLDVVVYCESDTSTELTFSFGGSSTNTQVVSVYSISEIIE